MTRRRSPSRGSAPARRRGVLVTGFEPFGGHATNPSEEVARAVAGARVHAEILPVDFVAVRPALGRLLARRWDAVLMLGLAEGASQLRLERVAINFRQQTPDNRGRLPERPEVVRGGPAAYFSTLPLEEIRKRIAATGLPVEISLSAGAYLCNAAFYLARHRLDSAGTPCGFLHLPGTPGLGDRGTPMRIEDEIRGVGIALETLLSTSRP